MTAEALAKRAAEQGRAPREEADRPRLGSAAACYRIPEVAPTLDEARAYCKQPGRVALRKLPCRHMVPAQGAAPAFSRHLRLLPHLRRSGRRGGRPRRGAGAAGSVGPRTRRLLRGPRAPSGLCRAGRDHPRVRHSQGAVCRSAHGLSPGPDGYALRHHGGRARSTAATRPTLWVALCSTPAARPS